MSDQTAQTKWDAFKAAHPEIVKLFGPALVLLFETAYHGHINP